MEISQQIWSLGYSPLIKPPSHTFYVELNHSIPNRRNFTSHFLIKVSSTFKKEHGWLHENKEVMKFVVKVDKRNWKTNTFLSVVLKIIQARLICHSFTVSIMRLSELLISVLLTLSSSSAGSYNRYHSDEFLNNDHLSSTKLGKFQLFWDAIDPYFYVIHSDEPDKILFQTLPSQSFVTVGYATDSNPPIVDGNFKVSL